MKKYCLIFIIIILSIHTSNAQNIKLKGVVKDSFTGEYVDNANVLIQDKNLHIITNSLGEFDLVSPAGNVLIVTHIGYKSENILVPVKDSTITVYLSPTNYLFNTVNVFSRKKDDIDLNAYSIQNKQINDFAGMTRDALRAIQVLPGVSVNNEASAKVNVRGGTSEENIIMIDGIEVNEPFHLKEGPATSIGVFNIDMVENIDFTAGAYGAEYGDALSSIVKVDYKKGDPEKYSGKANLSLIDIGVVAEGPLFSKNSSFIIGVRNSFIKYLMDFLRINPNMHLSYYDIQGVLNYQISTQNHLRLSFLASSDNFNYDPSTKTMSYWDRISVNKKLYDVSNKSNSYKSQEFIYKNYMFSLSYSNIFTEKLLSKVSVSYYNEITDENTLQTNKINTVFQGKPNYFMEYNSKGGILNDLKIKTFDFTSSLDYMLNPSLTLSGGMKYKKLNYDTNVEYANIESMTNNVSFFPDTILVNYPLSEQYNDTVYSTVNSFKIGGYLQSHWQIRDNLLVNIGARVDYFDMNKQAVFSPRFNIAFQTPWNFIIKAGLGVFNQAPSFKQFKLNYADPNNTKYQKAIHYVFGIDNICLDNLKLKAELYYKKYASLVPVIKAGNGMLLYKSKRDAEGYSNGADLQANYNFGPYSVWISYGYLIVREKLKDFGGYYPRFTDQRNTLSIVFNADLGKMWSTTLRGFYGSGFAYTPDTITYNNDFRVFQWKQGSQNSSHFPEYIRIDFRIEKSFLLFERTVDIYLDIMNILNRKNIYNYDYVYDDYGNPIIEERVLFPIIPTLGFSLSF